MDKREDHFAGKLLALASELSSTKEANSALTAALSDARGTLADLTKQVMSSEDQTQKAFKRIENESMNSGEIHQMGRERSLMDHDGTDPQTTVEIINTLKAELSLMRTSLGCAERDRAGLARQLSTTLQDLAAMREARALQTSTLAETQSATGGFPRHL